MLDMSRPKSAVTTDKAKDSEKVLQQAKMKIGDTPAEQESDRRQLVELSSL
jgi:hypothetical protein